MEINALSKSAQSDASRAPVMPSLELAHVGQQITLGKPATRAQTVTFVSPVLAFLFQFSPLLCAGASVVF